MKSGIVIKLLVGLVVCAITSCATTGFDEVRDPKLRQDLEAKWVRNKSSKMTTYYPDRETCEVVTGVARLQGIKESDISEEFYFSLDGGSHIIFLETDEKDGHARYHCIGLNEDREVEVFWVQYQEAGKDLVIEKMQVPRPVAGATTQR